VIDYNLVGQRLKKAREKEQLTQEKLAESACRQVSGNVRYRSDIGTEALFMKRINHMKELRK